MCLAKAFVNNWSGQPVFQDVARLRVISDRVELVTLFGEEKVISGSLLEIDFSTSKMLLKSSHTPGEDQKD
jgi:predicted RNA-binding protein